MPVEVLCIGHASCDVSLFVDEFPLENSKCEIRESLEACGGPAANAAWLLSSWGLQCAFAGLVGEDVQGRRTRDELVGVGANVSLLELRAGHATPLSMIIINKQNGSRTIVNRKLAGAPLRLDEATLRQLWPRVMLFDGHELEASMTALELFPDAISILDAGSWREGIAALANRVHYLAASERFALQATGMASLRDETEQRACLMKLRDKFRSKIIVTMGQGGLIVDDGSGFGHLPAFPARAVDTTAAGDSFCGSLVAALSQGLAMHQALPLACAAGALACTQPGAQSSIPQATDVAVFLAQQPAPSASAMETLRTYCGLPAGTHP